jgi:hypothetical protein
MSAEQLSRRDGLAAVVAVSSRCSALTGRGKRKKSAVDHPSSPDVLMNFS